MANISRMVQDMATSISTSVNAARRRARLAASEYECINIERPRDSVPTRASGRCERVVQISTASPGCLTARRKRRAEVRGFRALDLIRQTLLQQAPTSLSSRTLHRWPPSLPSGWPPRAMGLRQDDKE